MSDMSIIRNLSSIEKDLIDLFFNPNRNMFGGSFMQILTKLLPQYSEEMIESAVDSLINQNIINKFDFKSKTMLSAGALNSRLTNYGEKVAECLRG